MFLLAKLHATSFEVLSSCYENHCTAVTSLHVQLVPCCIFHKVEIPYIRLVHSEYSKVVRE